MRTFDTTFFKWIFSMLLLGLAMLLGVLLVAALLFLVIL